VVRDLALAPASQPAAAPLGHARAFVARHQARFTRELQEFVRIPSVSSDPARRRDVQRCAAWLRGHLQRIGLPVARIVETRGHPIVVGEWSGAPGKATVLVYGHYDVQPPGSLREWTRPPFDAGVENGFLHGRGASDDKGQLFTHVKAIESLLAATRQLPVNVKCLFEGEEETGSDNLVPFLEHHRHALRADAALMSDTRMLGPDQPALTYSLRGQLALELEVHGQRRDLHSGNFGGAVHDPLQALCEVLARLHDRDGRIAIPHFYDRVRRWSDVERDFLARTGPSDEAVLQEAGTTTAWGEDGFSVYERVTLRPSLAITGITGGHTGAGPKGVIPNHALAKLSFRLVPDQEPADIEPLVRGFIRRLAPPTVRVVMRTQIRSRPATIDRTHPAMRAAARAYRRAFGRTPVWVRSGGSIPVVSEFTRLLGIPTVLMGFASPGDSLHGPNERFSLRNFARGISCSIAFLEHMGERARR
jgi:acetylornithine deacetylase/succinyl-diaminopimelate desuccinylase-like protein